MITLYTKLVTTATKGKRKQVGKTDYTVGPGWKNPGGGEEGYVSALSREWWGGEGGRRPPGLKS